MVNVVDTETFSDHREQRKYRRFPSAELNDIVSAVERVEAEVFLTAEKGHELRAFDDAIAGSLSGYEYEHGSESGRNSATKIWKDKGFDHSVDLYHTEKRIAIEIEKSERKRVSDDLLKFIKGGQTWRDNRHRIEFGCLIVPTNYRGSGNVFAGAVTTLDFMRGVMHVEDVAVIGYKDPRWE